MDKGNLEFILENRRSVRSFTKDSVPEEDLKRLVELACFAPTGSNAQAWEYIVLNEHDKMKKFVRFAPGLFEVPAAMIFICTNTIISEKKAGKLGLETMSLMDVSMAGQNLMLAAYNMGYGSCALKGYDMEATSHILGLPEHIRPDLLIILGVPQFEAKMPKRKEVSEVIHFGGWNNENE